LLLFGGAVVLGVFKGIEYKSYLVAFAAAALVLFVYLQLRKKLMSRVFLCDRLHPLKLGLIISAICFALNLLYVFLVQMEPTVDFHTFWKTAVHLARGESLSSNTFVAAFPHILGYSAFLSLFLKLFGEHYIVASLVNVFLSAFSCMLIYMLCLRFFGRRAACMAALLWTICPSKMMYNSMVLSEPYYTFLFLATIYIIVELHFYFGKNHGNILLIAVAAAVVGLFLALANSARPIAAVVIIAFFIWLVFLRGDEIGRTALWKNWGIFASVMIVVYSFTGSAWTAFAEEKLGQEVPSLPGYNIYVGLNTTYWGSYYDEDMRTFEKYLYDGEHTVVEAQEEMLKLAKERITSGEIDFVRLFTKKLQTFLGCDEGGAYYSQAAISPLAYSIMAIVSNIWYYAVAVLVLMAIFSIMKQAVVSVFSLIPLFVVGLTLAQMLVEVAGRYHYSIIPMLLIIASITVKTPYKSTGD